MGFLYRVSVHSCFVVRRREAPHGRSVGAALRAAFGAGFVKCESPIGFVPPSPRKVGHRDSKTEKANFNNFGGMAPDMLRMGFRMLRMNIRIVI